MTEGSVCYIPVYPFCFEKILIDLKTEIIERVMNSITPSQENIDKLWAKEVEKRASEIESGKVKAIPGDDVFKEIQDKHSK